MWCDIDISVLLLDRAYCRGRLGLSRRAVVRLANSVFMNWIIERGRLRNAMKGQVEGLTQVVKPVPSIDPRRWLQEQAGAISTYDRAAGHCLRGIRWWQVRKPNQLFALIPHRLLLEERMFSRLVCVRSGNKSVCQSHSKLLSHLSHPEPA